METIKVNIERETAKALLVSFDGRQGWIQRRWLRPDGTVSAKTFDKAANSAAEKKAEAAAEKIWLDSFHAITVVRESEKAVAFEVVIDLCHVERTVTRLAWTPKSLLRDGKAPGWWIAKKVREIEDEMPAGHGARVESVGCEDW